MNDKRQKKVSIFHSLHMKISALAIFIAAMIVVLYTVMIMPGVKKNIQNIYSEYMLDLVLSNGSKMDETIKYTNNNLLSDTEAIGSVVNEVKLDNIDSSYSYVVSFDGTMLYHPTADKIGQPVENEAVKKMVSQVSAGTIPEPEVVKYDFNGINKYAACYTSENGFIFVVTADEKDLLSVSNKIESRGVFISILLLIFGVILALFSAWRMTKPLKKITDYVSRIASFDLSDDEKISNYAKKKDETGAIADSIIKMKDALVQIVKQIRNQSQRLYEDSEILAANVSNSSDNIESVETAVNEIATGATSQAQETQRATEEVITIGKMIEDTNAQVNGLNNTANVMNDSSTLAKDALIQLNEISSKVIDTINMIYEQTNITNESALKIKDATAIISSIAEETNLLSLNASIEAARAGEAGRGFAVVASQIQSLADQSSESTKQIDDIVHLLIADSEKAVHTMEDVKANIKNQNDMISQVQSAFEQVQDGIGKSITDMKEISNRTLKLDEARANIVDSVQSLTAIAEENAASTQETSASVMEITTIIQEINKNADGLKQVAKVLEDNVNVFVNI